MKGARTVNVVVIFAIVTIAFVGLALIYFYLAITSFSYGSCGTAVINDIAGDDGLVIQLAKDKPAGYIFSKTVTVGECVNKLILTNNYVAARRTFSGDPNCDRTKPAHIIIYYDLSFPKNVIAENPQCIGVPYKFDFDQLNPPTHIDTLVLEGGKAKLFCFNFKKTTDSKGVTNILLFRPRDSNDVVKSSAECV